jgi:hypothetical protein
MSDSAIAAWDRLALLQPIDEPLPWVSSTLVVPGRAS